MKHVQEKPYERKWSETPVKRKQNENRKSKSSNKAITDADTAGHPIGSDNTNNTNIQQEQQIAKRAKNGQFERMCRLLERVQYVERSTSSAEDNWDYEKIQNIYNTMHKKDFTTPHYWLRTYQSNSS